MKYGFTIRDGVSVLVSNGVVVEGIEIDMFKDILPGVSFYDYGVLIDVLRSVVGMRKERDRIGDSQSYIDLVDSYGGNYATSLYVPFFLVNRLLSEFALSELYSGIVRRLNDPTFTGGVVMNNGYIHGRSLVSFATKFNESVGAEVFKVSRGYDKSLDGVTIPAITDRGRSIDLRDYSLNGLKELCENNINSLQSYKDGLYDVSFYDDYKDKVAKFIKVYKDATLNVSPRAGLAVDVLRNWGINNAPLNLWSIFPGGVENLESLDDVDFDEFSETSGTRSLGHVIGNAYSGYLESEEETGLTDAEFEELADKLTEAKDKFDEFELAIRNDIQKWLNKKSIKDAKLFRNR